MSEFWISSQKSASEIEPGTVSVEVWNAIPRGITLIAMANIVAVTRIISRCARGP